VSEASQKFNDLVERFCSGDEEAFARIRSDFNRLVISLCVKGNVPDDELEDAAQEVWMRFSRNICRERDGIKEFFGYLYRIIFNVCDDYRNRKRSVLLSLDDEDFHNENEIPARDFKVELEVQDVIEELNLLPEPQRRAIILKEWEGYSIERIGQMMGESASNVKVLIHRGKTKIRKIFNRTKT